MELVAALRAADDSRALAALCSPDPSLVFFEATGHTYRGPAHWARRPAAAAIAGEPIALVQRARAGWIMLEEESLRTTIAAIADGGEWRLAHLHSSPVSRAPRPGGI
jgi:hypothetical protein